MLSKRSKATYLLLISMLLMFACDVSDIFPTPIPTATKAPQQVSHEVVIPESCYREGYQTYIALDRDYCFAYPVSYYVKADSNAKNTTLTYSQHPPEDMSSIEDVENLAGTGNTEISINISHTVNNTEDFNLNKFINEDESTNQYPNGVTPISLGNKDAKLRISVKESEKDGNHFQEVSYIIYVRHKEQHYYKITLLSDALISTQTSTAIQVEYLLFLILDTFTFIP